MLLPAMHLLRSLNGLGQPGMLPASLQGILELSPLERAAAVGQQAFLDAKSRADELEPGRLDPCSIHGARSWFRQCKELVRPFPYMLMCQNGSECIYGRVLNLVLVSFACILLRIDCEEFACACTLFRMLACSALAIWSCCKRV